MTFGDADRILRIVVRRRIVLLVDKLEDLECVVPIARLV